MIDLEAHLNFVHQMVAQWLELLVDCTTNFQVIVGNDNMMDCWGVCQNILLFLDSLPIQVNLHVIPFHGADVVFGVDWLKNLDDVAFNFTNCMLSFTHEFHHVRLMDTPPHFQEVEPNVMCRSYSPNIQLETFLWVAFVNDIDQPRVVPPTTLSSDDMVAQLILDDFVNIFSPTCELPPQRDTDHGIIIHLCVGPIKIHSYHYTRFQKEEMGRFVSSMLEEGIMQPTCSIPLIPLWLSLSKRRMTLDVFVSIIEISTTLWWKNHSRF